jgi:hypothetical protein
MVAVTGPSSLSMNMTHVCFSIPPPACHMFSTVEPPLYHSYRLSRWRMLCSIGGIYFVQHIPCLERIRTCQYITTLRKPQELPHMLHRSNRIRGRRMEARLGLPCPINMLATTNGKPRSNATNSCCT